MGCTDCANWNCAPRIARHEIARGACLRRRRRGRGRGRRAARRGAEARDRRRLLVGPRDELAGDAGQSASVWPPWCSNLARARNGRGSGTDPRLGVEGVGARPREQELGERLGEREAAREEVEELRASALVRGGATRGTRPGLEQRILVLVRHLRHRRRRRLRLRAAAAADLHVNSKVITWRMAAERVGELHANCAESCAAGELRVELRVKLRVKCAAANCRRAPSSRRACRRSVAPPSPPASRPCRPRTFVVGAVLDLLAAA